MKPVVNIYCMDADTLAPMESAYLPLLTPARRKAAEGYQEKSARLRVIAAGLLLYQELGVHKDSDLIFNEYGKPSLAAGKPQFSLSYAGHYAALAVAPFPIGVDIEPIKDNYPQILRKYFYPDELYWLDQVPNKDRFYTLWTRLESALKAEGTGFASSIRPYSLLENSTFFYKNEIHSGHMIACAASAQFDMRKICVTADSLLS